MRGFTAPEPVVLAQEPDFSLGGLRVCPSTRQVIAGETREMLQPRIMQVLVALARRRDEVVSRGELIAACWGGCAVSDDAITRCIARLRRLSETHGGFSLKTIPRVGYQLTEIATQAAPAILLTVQGPGRTFALIIAAAAAGILLAAGGFMVVH